MIFNIACTAVVLLLSFTQSRRWGDSKGELLSALLRHPRKQSQTAATACLLCKSKPTQVQWASSIKKAKGYEPTGSRCLLLSRALAAMFPIDSHGEHYAEWARTEDSMGCHDDPRMGRGVSLKENRRIFFG